MLSKPSVSACCAMARIVSYGRLRLFSRSFARKTINPIFTACPQLSAEHNISLPEVYSSATRNPYAPLFRGSAGSARLSTSLYAEKVTESFLIDRVFTEEMELQNLHP